MNLATITQLISIREYIYMTINNPALSRDEVTSLQSTLASIDKNIVYMLTSSDFQKLIKFVK